MTIHSQVHEAEPKQRPYLRVLFECCSVYQRIYRDLNGKSYTGRCPRCLRSIRFLIGANGTTSRDFSVF